MRNLSGEHLERRIPPVGIFALFVGARRIHQHLLHNGLRDGVKGQQFQCLSVFIGESPRERQRFQ